MQKSIDLTQLGGLNTYQETLDFLQQSYAPVLDALGNAFGNYLIITGVNVAGGNASAGWVIINGEILPFVQGAVATYCYVKITPGSEQFADGTSKSIYTTKQVVFTNIASGTTFAFTNLQRLPFNASSIQDALNTVQNLFDDLLNIEPAVIITGCIVSAINTGASTLAISAGKVLINGILVDAPAYAGAYPVYLPTSGTYTTAMPGAGTYITFDPYTSQYYLDVVFRNQHQTGDVVMNTQSSTLASFDVATGLGRWRWKGWKICDFLQSRVPLGYDRRTVNPGDGVWDEAYNGVGNTVGEKKHELTTDELPEFNLKNGVVDDKPVGDGQNIFVYGQTSEDLPGDARGNLANSPGNPLYQGYTSTIGSNNPHENRQPSVVILFIEKI